MTLWEWFLIVIAIYFFVIQVYAVIITISDKRRAKKGKRRIREKTLFLVSALGGSLAMYITMRKIRHKTQHKSFMIGIPCIMAAQILLIAGVVVLCIML